MARLIIAEKKTQAQGYQRVLGGRGGGDGYLKGSNGDKIIWCWGHLFREEEPRDKGITDWRDEDAWPYIEKAPRLLAIADKKVATQIRALRDGVKQSDEIVVATDPDREGETIGWNALLETGGAKKLILRMLCGEQNEGPIRKAFDSLQPGSRYFARHCAGRARSIVDMNWGINATVGATVALRPGHLGRGVWNNGRVKGPTLWLVVERERQIVNFKPTDYYDIVATIGTETGKTIDLVHAQRDPYLTDKSAAEAIAKAVDGAQVSLSVASEKVRKSPPKLFTKAAYLKVMGTALGWSPDRATEALQSLYERHGVVTYPRSGCAYISSTDGENVPATLAHLARIGDLGPIAGPMARGEAEIILRKGAVVNDAEVEKASHTAVIPTTKPADLDKLSDDQKDAYLAIAWQYVAAFMPDAVDFRTVVSTRIETDGQHRLFEARGMVEISPGWRAAFAGKSEETPLPAVNDGETGTVAESSLKAGRTKPPSRFTLPSLIDAMENVYRFVEDPKMREVLKRSKGIGTPATIEQIPLQLIQAGLIQQARNKHKTLSPSDEAVMMVEALELAAPAQVRPETTALFEIDLDYVEAAEDEAEAESRRDQVIAKWLKLVKDDFARVKAHGAANPASSGAGSSGGSGPSEKAIRFAENLAKRLNEPIPEDARADRRRLTEWIDAAQAKTGAPGSWEPSEAQIKLVRQLNAQLGEADQLQPAQITAMTREAAGTFISKHKKDTKRYPPRAKRSAQRRRGPNRSR